MGECVLMPPVAKILMNLSNMHVLFLSVRVLGGCVFIQRGLHCHVRLTHALVLLKFKYCITAASLSFESRQLN